MTEQHAEPARVRSAEGLWVVEVLSAAVRRWVVMGEFLTEEDARADLRNWQPDNPKGERP